MTPQQSKISFALQDHLRNACGSGISRYLAQSPEDRAEMEKRGITLSNFVFENVYPVITNMKVKSILVVMEQGIGNMVMLTPALKLLRELNPRLEITVLCNETSSHVIRNWDVVDSVITKFDNKFYDLAYLTIWSQAMCNFYQIELKSKCKTIFESHLKTFHESIQHAALVEFLDGYCELPMPHCDSSPIPDEIKKQITNKYIVLGDTTIRDFGWDAKRWPHYQELAKLFRKKLPDHKVVLIGDEEYGKEFESMVWTDNVVNIAGKTSLTELATVLKNSKFYVGNDTGPTHIAAAMGTKTYALFGPSLISKNKPIGPDVHVIKVNRPCSPCQYTDEFTACDCMESISANEVYTKIFHPENNKTKHSLLLVGEFGGGALRNEVYIKQCFEKIYKIKVIPYEYRTILNKAGNPIEATYDLINTIMNKNPDTVLICGGQQLVPEVLALVDSLSPNTTLINWYVDNRKQVEPWFRELSSVCHHSYWSTGDPASLSQVFSQTQKPCEFLPIVPDDTNYYPKDIKKDIDVLFVGIPHSQPRIDMLEAIAKASKEQGFIFKIFGNDGQKQGDLVLSEWPDSLKPFVNPGVFGKDFNDVLNRAKIVVNQNIVNDVPLYFSDRYFYPMAVKTVGLNYAVPNLEEMFVNGDHMVFWTNYDSMIMAIKDLLADDAKRQRISEAGYKLYKEKYTLNHILGQMMREIGIKKNAP